MKGYYKFCVYTNNARDGVQFVAAFDSLQLAQTCKHQIEYSRRGGCCDVVKKLFNPRTLRPFNEYIGNNYKYNY